MSKTIYRVSLHSTKGFIPAKFFETYQEAIAYGDGRKNFSGQGYSVMKWIVD